MTIARTPAAVKTETVETVRAIPADRWVKSLPNGNFEVTPAWLQDRFRLERELINENKRLRGDE